jgi:hypothetical protein
VFWGGRGCRIQKFLLYAMGTTFIEGKGASLPACQNAQDQISHAYLLFLATSFDIEAE